MSEDFFMSITFKMSKWQCVKSFFGGKVEVKITADEFTKAYLKALEEKVN